jgi:hypothetical protein
MDRARPMDVVAVPRSPCRSFAVHPTLSVLAAMTVSAALGPIASAQGTKASPLVAIEHEPPARLFVDPPLAGPLAQGRVFIQYRTENLRVLPVFGVGALTVSPRVGHVHITVDDTGWHFVDASGETVILVGLKPGPHRVLFELADPTHRVLTSETVTFTVPDPATPSRDH